MQESEFPNFNQIEQNLRKLIQTLPTNVGHIAVTFFTLNFNLQGFQADTLRMWQARQSESRKSIGRALLVNTGKLKRSIQFSAGASSVLIYSDVQYASYHNEGTARIPQRQFMGQSDALNKQIDQFITQQLDDAFKNI